MKRSQFINNDIEAIEASDWKIKIANLQVAVKTIRANLIEEGKASNESDRILNGIDRRIKVINKLIDTPDCDTAIETHIHKIVLGLSIINNGGNSEFLGNVLWPEYEVDVTDEDLRIQADVTAQVRMNPEIVSQAENPNRWLYVIDTSRTEDDRENIPLIQPPLMRLEEI